MEESSHSLIDPLDAGVVYRKLLHLDKAAAEFFTLTCLLDTTSTNFDIKHAIEADAVEGTVVSALTQTGGYGRQGRQWTSPPGGLYLSLLLRPEAHGKRIDEVAELGLIIGLAVRRAILNLGMMEAVSIKWPNDVLCSEGKLSGISVEKVKDAVCVGIGVNAIRSASEQNLPGKNRLAYVQSPRQSGLSPIRCREELAASHRDFLEDIMAELLTQVYFLYNQWLTEGFSSLRDEYRNNAFLQGRHVQLLSLSGDVLCEGTVCDVDEQGHLCLIDQTGIGIKASSGEAHLV